MSHVKFIMKMIAFTALFLFAFFVNVESIFAATTYYVDDNCPGPNYYGTFNDPFCSIQSGINTALAGDTVQVAAGNYIEHIVMKSGVIIQGAGVGVSIINGSGTGTVVVAENVNYAAKLDGFTIMNGHSDEGGGMKNINSSPVVSNCIFTDNDAITDGGGMSNNNSSPSIVNCRFIHNMAIYIGGGMLNYNNSSPSLLNCEFTGNTAGDSGGGIASSVSSPKVVNCIFWGNAASSGGGILNTASSPVFTNCTITLNSVSGICNEVGSYPVVTNSIIWGNNLNQISNNSESGITITYSNIQGGYAGTGNINTDPMFVDSTHGDFHLKQNSPCIDAGDNSATHLPDKDIDGDNRKVNNPSVHDTGNGTPPIVDMGADEYYDEHCDEFPWELFYPAFMMKRNKAAL